MKEIGGVKFDKANDRWSLVKVECCSMCKSRSSVRIRDSYENGVRARACARGDGIVYNNRTAWMIRCFDITIEMQLPAATRNLVSRKMKLSSRNPSWETHTLDITARRVGDKFLIEILIRMQEFFVYAYFVYAFYKFYYTKMFPELRTEGPNIDLIAK